MPTLPGTRSARWFSRTLIVSLFTLTVTVPSLAQNNDTGKEKEQGQEQAQQQEQEHPQEQEKQERSAKTFFPNVLTDQKQVWTFPTRGESWKKPGLWVAIGLSGASFALDGRPAERLRTDPCYKGFNDVFASNGSAVVIAGVPLALTAAGELAGHDGLTQIGWKTSEAALDAYVVSTVLKLVTQRSRPHKGSTHGFWEGGNSFPSGHAAVVWAIAATTAHHFEKRKWVAWVVYPVAAVVSFSRVTSGNHFPSDAVAGSALGFAIGRYVVD
jgi:hypothetical protein